MHKIYFLSIRCLKLIISENVGCESGSDSGFFGIWIRNILKYLSIYKNH